MENDKPINNMTGSQLRVALHSLSQIKDLPLFLCNLPGLGTKNNAEKLKKDFEKLQLHGINCVVNLLNKYEMRAHGSELDAYLKAAKDASIEVLLYDIVEMDVPPHKQGEFDKLLLDPIAQRLKLGQKVMVHCRAGVGRAGLVSACMLLKLGHFPTSEETIKYLRTVRHPNCVESDKQRRYVKGYQMFIEATHPS